MDSPNQAEVVSAQRRLNQTIVEKEIVEYEDEMLALENLMIEMKQKRYALNEKLNRTSSFSSILPWDVITEIFFMVYESQDKTNFRVLPVPFILGRICKAWRRIVWSTPRLWSIIMIRFSEKNHTSQGQLVREWIPRAGSSPLHLYLDSFSSEEPTESIFKFLLESCSRWATLDSFAFCGLSTAIQERHSFPSLSRIRLHGFCNTGLATTSTSFKFRSAPQLRRFDTLSLKTPCSFMLNWMQLEDIAMCVPVKFCIERLQSLQGLRTLRLNLGGPADFNTIANKLPHLLRNLTHLSLAGPQNYIARILCAITTPSLKSLVIDVTQPTTDIIWLQNTVDLQTRSLCKLLELSITNGYASELQSIEIWRSLSTLTQLSLDSLKQFSLSDFTINLLNPYITQPETDSEKPLLPNLNQFKYRGNIGFRPTTMAKMLEERLVCSQKSPVDNGPNIETLRSVDITYWNRGWGETGGSNPNILRDFYRQILLLSSRGTTLDMVWEATEVH